MDGIHKSNYLVFYFCIHKSDFWPFFDTSIINSNKLLKLQDSYQTKNHKLKLLLVLLHFQLGKELYQLLNQLNLLLQVPVFAEIRLWCVQSKSNFLQLLLKLHWSALGKSILFTTGNSSKSLSIAIYTFAIVCASTPCVESTIIKHLQMKLKNG